MRSAFTLVEILAGLLLFALGVMGVIGVIAFGQRSAARAQAEATGFMTAMSVLKDPLPLGAATDPATGTMSRWAWTGSGQTRTATDDTGIEVWAATSWPIDQPGDILVPDMAKPMANNPSVFPAGGAPLAGCAHGWLNGYYVERREQSRASDRIGAGTRIVEVRVDVYAVAYGGGDGRPLASVVDRVVRQAAP